MIVNITQGATFRPAIEYGAGIRKKEKCSELVETHNLLSSDSAGIADEMSCVAGYSRRVKKPVLHLSVNFHPDESPDREVMLKATYAYLEEMKIPADRHQIAIYEHHDTPHKHFHVFINRVDPDSCTAYDDSFLHVRNEAACRKVEQELGLRPTDSIIKVRREKNEKKARGKGEQDQVGGEGVSTIWSINDKDEHRFAVRHFVHSAVEKALAGGVRDREGLARFLNKLNIEATWKDDSQGNFVGASFRYDNLSITGNAAGFTARDLRMHFSGEKPCVEKIERIPGKGGVTVELSADQEREVSKITGECWNRVRRQLGYHFESQAVESFPFTDLLRMVAKKSDLNEAQVYAYVSGFELRMKKILPDIKKKEKQAFERTSKSLLVLTDSIMGNTDSRNLFLTAMNVERRGNLLYLREPGHLRYSATHDEISFLENAPFSSSVFIPREFSFAERSVLLNTASGKEISQSFYDLNPNRLKKIFQPAFYDKIETQLNENYVRNVLANSPVKLEDKIAYMRQRGIIIEATTNGGYELGFMGNSNTGEMRCRMPAGETFTRMLKASGYGRHEQEASRSHLLSQRGRMAVDLAQALDTGNSTQARYVMDQAHRLNREYAIYTDPHELLEVLSGRSGTVRGQNSELAREARKIQWKNRRR